MKRIIFFIRLSVVLIGQWYRCCVAAIIAVNKNRLSVLFYFHNVHENQLNCCYEIAIRIKCCYKFSSASFSHTLSRFGDSLVFRFSSLLFSYVLLINSLLSLVVSRRQLYVSLWLLDWIASWLYSADVGWSIYREKDVLIKAHQ